MILKISEKKKKEAMTLEDAFHFTIAIRELMDDTVAMYCPRVYERGKPPFAAMHCMEEIKLLVELYELMVHIIMKEIMKYQMEGGISLLDYHLLYRMSGSELALNEVGKLYRCIQQKYNYSLDFLREVSNKNDVKDMEVVKEKENNPEEREKIQAFADIFFEKRKKRKEQYQEAGNKKIQFWSQLEQLLESCEELQMCITEEDELAIYRENGEILRKF